jgi:hypothetical protein
VRHPRRRSARSVEDHFVPRPRQGYVRQRPWRGVRVEGVAAVRLNQCRSEKWRENGMGRDYSGAAENACRQLLLPATRCTERFAPLSSPVCERTWYLGKGPHWTSADPWLRRPAGRLPDVGERDTVCRMALLSTVKRRCRTGSAFAAESSIRQLADCRSDAYYPRWIEIAILRDAVREIVHPALVRPDSPMRPAARSAPSSARSELSSASAFGV